MSIFANNSTSSLAQALAEQRNTRRQLPEYYHVESAESQPQSLRPPRPTGIAVRTTEMTPIVLEPSPQPVPEPQRPGTAGSAQQPPAPAQSIDESRPQSQISSITELSDIDPPMTPVRNLPSDNEITNELVQQTIGEVQLDMYQQLEKENNKQIETFLTHFEFSNLDPIDPIMVCDICHRAIFSYKQCKTCSHISCSYCLSFTRDKRCAKCKSSKYREGLRFWPRDMLAKFDEATVQCKWCEALVKWKTMSRHLASCITTCILGCGARVLRSGMHSHLLVCANKTLACCNQLYGCQVQGKSSELRRHETFDCPYTQYELSYQQFLINAKRCYSDTVWATLFDENKTYVIVHPILLKRFKCRLKSYAATKSDRCRKMTIIEMKNYFSALQNEHNCWRISLVHDNKVSVPDFNDVLPVPVPCNGLNINLFKDG